VTVSARSVHAAELAPGTGTGTSTGSGGGRRREEAPEQLTMRRLRAAD
jgi:hypothetical protein